MGRTHTEFVRLFTPGCRETDKLKNAFDKQMTEWQALDVSIRTSQTWPHLHLAMRAMVHLLSLSPAAAGAL